MKRENEKKKQREEEREREEGYETKERNKTRPSFYRGCRREAATMMLEDGGDVAIAHVPESGNKKTNRQARVAFVARGTAAITCQLWGTGCLVCLSLEREHRGGLSPGRRSGG